MDINTIIVGAILVVLLVIAGILIMQRRRTDGLRRQFGPEYNRVMEENGRREAEAELVARRDRVKAYDIHPLPAAERDRFTGSWSRVQTEFVDNPKGAVAHADQLVEDVMAARGYPMSDFEQVAADLSVDHPVVVQNYRAAHAIALRREAGGSATEDLRQAMIHYRTLFEALLGGDAGGRGPAVA
jgi:hypothetical protein